MNNASNIFSAWFRRIGVWASLVALVLVSCQKEEDDLSTGVTLYPALATHVENVIRTRGTLTVQDAASNAADAAKEKAGEAVDAAADQAKKALGI